MAPQNNFTAIPTPNTLDSNTTYQEQHQGSDRHQVEDNQQGDEEPLYPASALLTRVAARPPGPLVAPLWSPAATVGSVTKRF